MVSNFDELQFRNKICKLGFGGIAAFCRSIRYFSAILESFFIKAIDSDYIKFNCLVGPGFLLISLKGTVKEK